MVNMPKSRKVPLPKGKYISEVVVENDFIEIKWKKRKKVGLLLIGVNDRYWPYLAQVIKDCKQHFLPQHKVEFHIWSDVTKEKEEEWVKYTQETAALYESYLKSTEKEKTLSEFANRLIALVMRFEKTTFEGFTQALSLLATNGMQIKRGLVGVELHAPPHTPDKLAQIVNDATNLISQSIIQVIKDITAENLHETDAIDWPAPTLMRYHLFLNEEEKLKGYDYLFYLDADMRVVEKISDEILGEGLTTAPHPGYAVSSKFIPPYEPNKDSSAFIPRLGTVKNDEKGKPRFTPFYAAGGFQGGKTRHFMQAMKTMKRSIDSDFNKNYVAIWNDESHWNKYLFEYQKKGGDIIFLDPSYVFPDSLIKEYYEKIWGRSYVPKIITLTKPFSLSEQAASELQIMSNTL